MKGLVVTLFLLTALGITLQAQDTPAEPERLTELRKSWLAAKDRDSRPIRKAYLDRLVQLRDEFTRQEQLESAQIAAEEIKTLTSAISGENALVIEPKEFANSQLAGARDRYERLMTESAAKNNRIYLQALERLKSQYSKATDLEAAVAVGKEIKSVSSIPAKPKKKLSRDELDENLQVKPDTVLPPKAYIEQFSEHWDPDHKPAGMFRELWGKKGVYCLHSTSEPDPTTVDFSRITRKSAGTLIIYLHKHPYGDFSYEIFVNRSGQSKEVVKDPGWVTVRVPFDNESVRLEMYDHEKNYFDYAFISYDVEPEEP